MALTEQTSFAADSTKPLYIPCPAFSKITVSNLGNTLYYKSTADVTSSSNDGNIATAAQAAFAAGKFVITATGVSTNVMVRTDSSPGTSSSVDRVANAAPSTATSGTDTAFANGTLFLTSIAVPGSMVATGVGYLIGSVGGTDLAIVSLYDEGGRFLVSSATAGTTVGTAANTQTLSFTAPVQIPGPGKYYLGVQANGGTAKLRTVIAQTSAGIQAGSVSVTFGTMANVVAPTTFTADKAPFAWLF